MGCSLSAMWRLLHASEHSEVTEAEHVVRASDVAGMPAPSISPGLMKTVFRNSAWSTFAVIASPVLQFLFGGLTLRYVGVEATGFSLAVGAVLGIAARFGTCGIGEAALPAIAAALGSHDDRRVRGLVGVVLAVFGLSSMATAVALLAFAGPFVQWSKSPVDATEAAKFIAIACVSHVLGQLSLALTTILRAAGRYDLVTAVTTPLALVSGIAACTLVPLFPSLMTVAIIGLVSAAVGLLVGLGVASRAVPAVCRPLLGLASLPSLARYGFWLLLTHAFGALTGGVDDLVITGSCGAAVVPPWAIGKRLWLTAHTFLAQHTEHLIPTLGSLRHTARDAADGVAMAMHWYVMLLAAVGYTLMASWGGLIVGAVAGGDVATMCQPAIFAYSLLGIAYALLIIPVVVSLAAGASRPAFVVALLSNTAQLAAVFGLARSFGAPAVYYAPVAALPVLFLATGTTATSIFDVRAACRRIKPVLVPIALGYGGVVSSMAILASDLTDWQRMAAGVLLAAGVFVATISTERVLAINSDFHNQLVRVVRHALDVATGSAHRLFAKARGRTPESPEKAI
jgi:O-antigen/teichoic acid export membrane protein